MEITPVSQKSKPPYLIGLLCLIPLIGAVVGLVLLVFGIIKYKDKWLCIIGAAGIFWTIFVFASFFYTISNASVFKKGFEEISQMQLNNLVKHVEFYKLIHGQYPGKLDELLDDDKLAPVNDPVIGLDITGLAFYHYERVGDKYLLFSAGQDGKPNTKDDLFPQLKITEYSKIGWIKYK